VSRIAQPAATTGHLHPSTVSGGQYNIIAAILTIVCDRVVSTGLLLRPGLLASNTHWPGTDKQLLVLTQPSTPLLSSLQLTIMESQLLRLPELQRAQMGMPGSDQLPSCQVTTGTPGRQNQNERVSTSCRLMQTIIMVLRATM
jgi:hypothetical protein